MYAPCIPDIIYRILIQYDKVGFFVFLEGSDLTFHSQRNCRVYGCCLQGFHRGEIRIFYVIGDFPMNKREGLVPIGAYRVRSRNNLHACLMGFLGNSFGHGSIASELHGACLETKIVGSKLIPFDFILRNTSCSASSWSG